MNISITTACDRACAYCFARAPGGAAAGAVRRMDRDTFLRTIGLVERSGVDDVRLLGGEPTLHPDLAWMVAQVLGRGLRLLVFSHGLVHEDALATLEACPADRLTVLVNVPATAPRAEQDRRGEVLGRLGARAVVGMNIDQPGFDGAPLLELVARHGLRASVRLGLAHPIDGGDNRWLPPRLYPEVGRGVADFARRAAQVGVGLELDCGFVPCMFPGGRDALGRAGEGVGRRCNPVLDVLPEGQVIPCYPLAAGKPEAEPGGGGRDALPTGTAGRSAPLPDRGTAGELRARFAETLSPLRELGIYPRCSTCDERARGGCTGGCLAAAMRRLRPARFTLEIPPTRRPAPPRASTAEWVVPYVDQPLAFWEALHADLGEHVSELYFPLPAGIVGSGRPPQPAQHLDALLRRGLFRPALVVNPITLPGPVEDVAPRVVDAVKRLHDDVGLASVTVANPLLAEILRAALPGLPLVGSVLLDIARPIQVSLLAGVFDTLVPSGRVLRDLDALRALREAFPGRLRLLVNEACLPGCPSRVQHFHEMAQSAGHPRSLCEAWLERRPWLRLTGTWVLPQHLHVYAGLYDELKLAGRVTLSDPARYRRVLDAYVHRRRLGPHEIGGGPASVLEPLEVTEAFFRHTLACGQRCGACSVCRDAYETGRRGTS